MAGDRPPHIRRGAVRTRIAAGVLGLSLLCGVKGASLAQEPFPAQSIEIVATFGPGGGADLMAKKMAQLLEPILGVPLFVTNVAGASGNAGLTRLLTHPADGYTIATLVSTTVSAWASGVGYARPADFVVLAIVQYAPSMLFVPADSPFQSFTELLDFAQAYPGKLKVATAGDGSRGDLTLRYFTAIGYKMVGVPYAKPEDRYASPFGKRTQALHEEPGDLTALLASKRLRPLVVFDTKRHVAFKNVPSSKELGFQIHDMPNFRMLAVRAGTPADRVKLLTEAIDKALDAPEWQRFCAATYSCTRKHAPEEAMQRVQEFFETIQNRLKQFSSPPQIDGAVPPPRDLPDADVPHFAQ